MGRPGGAGQTKPARALTNRTLESLKPDSAPYRIPDSKCGGLAVRVAADGVVTFDLAFRIRGGLVRRVSLGRFPQVSLDAARDRANELTRAGRAGRDLIAEEKAAKAEAERRLTVSRLIDDYLKRQVKGRLRTAKEIENRLLQALATKLEMAAEDIRRRDLRELFDNISDAGFTREAEKRRQTVGAMFRWAVSRDLLDTDPTAGLKAYDPGTPRDRVLTEEEIREFWARLDASTMPTDHADVLRLQLALGARCGEIAGMNADEIDTQAWVWTLPGERSKNGKFRITPIVGVARDILSSRLPAQGALFRSETDKPLTSAHVGHALMVRRDSFTVAPFSTHDLRRTFATGLDVLGIGLDLIAAIVGHDTSTGRDTKTLVRHYLRTDKLEKKRGALEAWDARLRDIIAGKVRDSKKVVTLPLKSAG